MPEKHAAGFEERYCYDRYWNPPGEERIGTRAIERPADDADDAELASYNAYLAKLNAEVKGHNKWRR